jgi:predicted SprT family Zn-dependent metalloprotease
MNTSKILSSVKNRTQPGGTKGTGELFCLAVLFEMNPALRDLSEEELFEWLISHELAEEWSSGGRSQL